MRASIPFSLFSYDFLTFSLHIMFHVDFWRYFQVSGKKFHHAVYYTHIHVWLEIDIDLWLFDTRIWDLRQRNLTRRLGHCRVLLDPDLVGSNLAGQTLCLKYRFDMVFLAIWSSHSLFEFDSSQASRYHSLEAKQVTNVSFSGSFLLMNLSNTYACLAILSLNLWWLFWFFIIYLNPVHRFTSRVVE